LSKYISTDWKEDASDGKEIEPGQQKPKPVPKVNTSSQHNPTSLASQTVIDVDERTQFAYCNDTFNIDTYESLHDKTEDEKTLFNTVRPAIVCYDSNV